MSLNIAYQSEAIAEYYSRQRCRWDQFYPSERWIFDRLAGTGFGQILDVGCAAGGLGIALSEHTLVAGYTGIDINGPAIAAAERQHSKQRAPGHFVHADILAWSEPPTTQFDLVVSLSAVDWNVETDRMLAACWDRVSPGGHLVLSLRLTEEQGCRDPERSFQPIGFTETEVAAAAERAPYVVLRLDEALRMFLALDPVPTSVLGYGYWGAPSATAHTPYDRLVFAVFAVAKPLDGDQTDTRTELHLPADLIAAIR